MKNIISLCTLLAFLFCWNQSNAKNIYHESVSKIEYSELGGRITFQDIAKYAPEIRMHPGEKYFPMHPAQFIRESRLRHDKGGWFDEGYNKVKRKWERTNSRSSSYYNIPMAVLNRYKLHSNGKNRRPLDKNRGSSWNVFLQPKGKPAGTRRPTHNVPVYYFVKQNSREYKISYWYFFGYNDGWGKFNHQGDWEHITVVLDKRTKAFKGIYMAGHGKVRYYRKSQIAFARTHPRYPGTHPIVYSAKGTHATYEKVGSFHIFGTDKTGNGGVKWQTWKNCKPLKNQSWKHFAGAWGEVGTYNKIQESHSTGPLGPWQKRWKN